MAYFTWDDSFKVGVREIDEQHHGLVELVNELHEAMKIGKGQIVLETTLNKLIEYTLLHFKTEEKYFQKFGYPEAASHKQEHADFVQKVSEFKVGFDKGTLLITLDILDFLSKWLNVHIKGTDKKYGPYFNQHGLT